MAKKRKQAAAAITAPANSTNGTNTSNDAAEGQCRKKRKAAEASIAKTKLLAEEEVEELDESDDDRDGAVRTTHLGVSTSHLDLIPQREMKPVRAEDMPLVAPGFHLWEDFSRTVSGTDLAALTKSKPAKEYGEKYGFTLQPLILTEGPLAGRKMLMLQETKRDTFRFMDLPPEIRNMVYRCLLDEDKDISISSYQPQRPRNSQVLQDPVPRRPVRGSFRPGTEVRRGGLTWDTINGKWLGQEASGYSLLAVSRQILQETASIAYGSNTFSSWRSVDFLRFLRHIGSMRHFIRKVDFPARSNDASSEQSIYKLLADATDLQKITFRHSDVCRSPSTYPYRRRDPTGLVDAMKPLLLALQKHEKQLEAEGQRSDRDLKRIAHIKSTEVFATCMVCTHKQEYDARDGARSRVWYDSNEERVCKKGCEDRKTHDQEVRKAVRVAIKKVLK